MELGIFWELSQVQLERHTDFVPYGSIPLAYTGRWTSGDDGCHRPSSAPSGAPQSHVPLFVPL